MRGTASGCCVDFRQFVNGDRLQAEFSRSAFNLESRSAGLPSDLMMNDPALNCRSPILNASSAAPIFTSFNRKRSVRQRVVGVVIDDIARFTRARYFA